MPGQQKKRDVLLIEIGDATQALIGRIHDLEKYRGISMAGDYSRLLDAAFGVAVCLYDVAARVTPAIAKVIERKALEADCQRTEAEWAAKGDPSAKGGPVAGQIFAPDPHHLDAIQAPINPALP